MQMENKIYTTSLDYSVNLYNIDNQENTKINFKEHNLIVDARLGSVYDPLKENEQYDISNKRIRLSHCYISVNFTYFKARNDKSSVSLKGNR
jgi:hypothetical protein